MNRQEYNKCITPYMRGSKPKEQRQFDMCVGAKLCSGKAETEEEARNICSLPKEPKKHTMMEKTKNACAYITNMEEWIKQPDDKICRPCLLGPVTQWYRDELQENRLGELAKEVESAVDNGEVALAAKLDEIKEKVSPELKERLREFDCHAQLYKGEKYDK
jgi:hypothetical protein